MSFSAGLTRAASLAALLGAVAASVARADEPTWFGAKQTAAVRDPRVEACLALGLRGEEPGRDPSMSRVEDAAFKLDFATIEDAVAKCRLALHAFPAEPKVIVAYYFAASALASVLFDAKDAPTSDQAALQRVIADAAAAPDGNVVKRVAAFFIGSAYEFGVGAAADPMKAAAAYRAAANAGDAIAARELARLTAGGQVKP